MRGASAMSYKTILVHLNDKRRAEAVLEPAAELAARYNSHLIGLHVYASMPAPPVRLPGSSVLGGVAAGEHQHSDEIATIFQRMTANKPFVPDWQVLKVAHVDLAPVVMERGRAADLIVAGQTDPDWDLSPLLDFPERLALEGGRPVLVIPYAGRYPKVGQNVVVAWKASRESARAVFDALPLLQGAQNVHILEIREHGSKKPELAPDTSIAAALARHGIKPNIRTSVASDISIGDEILSRLADLDADLLVMGAYGQQVRIEQA